MSDPCHLGALVMEKDTPSRQEMKWRKVWEFFFEDWLTGLSFIDWLIFLRWRKGCAHVCGVCGDPKTAAPGAGAQVAVNSTAWGQSASSSVSRRRQAQEECGEGGSQIMPMGSCKPRVAKSRWQASVHLPSAAGQLQDPAEAYFLCPSWFWINQARRSVLSLIPVYTSV